MPSYSRVPRRRCKPGASTVKAQGAPAEGDAVTTRIRHSTASPSPGAPCFLHHPNPKACSSPAASGATTAASLRGSPQEAIGGVAAHQEPVKKARRRRCWEGWSPYRPHREARKKDSQDALSRQEKGAVSDNLHMPTDRLVERRRRDAVITPGVAPEVQARGLNG